MQGVIFVTFSDLVIEKFGLSTLNKIIEQVNPPSEGAYTAGGEYPCSELMALVKSLSDELQVPANDLVKAFGHYLFSTLIKTAPIENIESMTAIQLLLSVDDVIHKEVMRVHPNAYLPSMKYNHVTKNSLQLEYHSIRKLCQLTEGLIEGMADFYNETVTIEHTQCMHDGFDVCKMNIKFSKRESSQ